MVFAIMIGDLIWNLIVTLLWDILLFVLIALFAGVCVYIVMKIDEKCGKWKNNVNYKNWNDEK